MVEGISELREGVLLGERYRLARRLEVFSVGAERVAGVEYEYWVALDERTAAEVWIQFAAAGGVYAEGAALAGAVAGLRRINHPAVPAVHAFGEYEFEFNGELRTVGYCAIPALEGETLAAAMVRETLDRAEILLALGQIAEVLQLLGEFELVHGHLSAHSVLLTATADAGYEVVLIDLPASLALETTLESELTAAADVYALAWLTVLALVGPGVLEAEFGVGFAATLEYELLALQVIEQRRAWAAENLEVLGVSAALAEVLLFALGEASTRPRVTMLAAAIRAAWVEIQQQAAAVESAGVIEQALAVAAAVEAVEVVEAAQVLETAQVAESVGVVESAEVVEIGGGQARTGAKGAAKKPTKKKAAAESASAAAGTATGSATSVAESVSVEEVLSAQESAGAVTEVIPIVGGGAGRTRTASPSGPTGGGFGTGSGGGAGSGGGTSAAHAHRRRPRRGLFVGVGAGVVIIIVLIIVATQGSGKNSNTASNTSTTTAASPSSGSTAAGGAQASPSASPAASPSAVAASSPGASSPAGSTTQSSGTSTTPAESVTFPATLETYPATPSQAVQEIQQAVTKAQGELSQTEQAQLSQIIGTLQSEVNNNESTSTGAAQLWGLLHSGELPTSLNNYLEELASFLSSSGGS
ncbi:hypothetical protein [Actinospica robiniae]|uniref:hypothetical protein n=1 Tax=Actinospica robiniae TaxID=304901 RepID=UPI0012FC85E1|nr:hypothetical protein [Actinospica robiniae]